MPIVFSKSGASAFGDHVPWIDKFIYLAETGQLTTDVKTLGFKAYISNNDPLLNLTPLQYLKLYRVNNIYLITVIKKTNEDFIRKALRPNESSPPPTMNTAQE